MILIKPNRGHCCSHNCSYYLFPCLVSSKQCPVLNVKHRKRQSPDLVNATFLHYLFKSFFCFLSRMAKADNLLQIRYTNLKEDTLCFRKGSKTRTGHDTYLHRFFSEGNICMQIKIRHSKIPFAYIFRTIFLMSLLLFFMGC